MTPSRRSSTLAVAAVVIVLVGTLTTAAAAGLGGIDTASLWAWSDEVTVDVPEPEDPPDPVALRCDTFEGPGGPLDGRIPSCGGSAWSTVGRPWTVAAGRVDVNGGSGSSATLDAGVRNVTVEVTVFDVDQPNRTGGVILASSGGTDHVAAVLRGRSSVELRLGNGAVLASTTAERTTRTTLRVTLVDNDVQVAIDGTVVLSGTFALDTLTGTRVGLVHDGGPPVGFSDFSVAVSEPS